MEFQLPRGERGVRRCGSRPPHFFPRQIPYIVYTVERLHEGPILRVYSLLLIRYIYSSVCVIGTRLSISVTRMVTFFLGANRRYNVCLCVL